MSTNLYTRRWFSVFLPPDLPGRPDELDFVQTHLPSDRFSRLLDWCCGVGRHANALAERGYHVLGVDRDVAAIESAKASANASANASADASTHKADGVANVGRGSAEFRLMDMREVGGLEHVFDGVLSMWASYGFFSAEENALLLAALTTRLRPGGRILLDVYNRDGVAGLPASEVLIRDGQTVGVERLLAGDRFKVELTYSRPDERETMEWQVHTPAEIADVAEQAGLIMRTTCAWFDDSTPAGPEHARMQVVLEKLDPA